MKKILFTLACCALLLGIYHQTTADTVISQIKNCPRSTILFYGKYPYIRECANCISFGGSWDLTAKTCLCIGKGQECWYGVCVDLKEGLNPENLEKGVDLASKTVDEINTINRKSCCKLKSGNWNGATCTF